MCLIFEFVDALISQDEKVLDIMCRFAKAERKFRNLQWQ